MNRGPAVSNNVVQHREQWRKPVTSLLSNIVIPPGIPGAYQTLAIKLGRIMALSILADATERSHAHLMRNFSFEIMARDADRIDTLRDLVPAGTMVSVTYLAAESDRARIAAARAVRAAGFVPMPHIAARRIRSTFAFQELLDEITTEAGIDRVFIIAGDISAPLGPFADALALIETGRLSDFGIKRVGIGGYPEGHPGIPTERLDRAMRDKLRALADQRIEAEIMTQFAFSAEPMIAWLTRLRAAGIANPVRLGLPGPANVGTLMRFASRCGVGASAKVMNKYGASIGRLLSAAGPDLLYRDLATDLQAFHGPVSVHLFPFGGLLKMAEWARETISV